MTTGAIAVSIFFASVTSALTYSARPPVFRIRSKFLRISLPDSTFPTIWLTFAGVGFSPKSTSACMAAGLSSISSSPASFAHSGSFFMLERPNKIKLHGCVSASLTTHSAVTPLAPPLTKNTDFSIKDLPGFEVVRSRMYFG